MVLAETHHEAAYCRRGAGLLKACTQDEHGGHRERRRIAESGKPLLRRNQAQEEQGAQTEQCHHVERVLLGNEQSDRSDENGKYENRV